MITEKGAIKTEFSDFVGMQKKYYAVIKIISIILLIVGSLGLIAYIAVATVLETDYESAPAWCDALLIFAVPFAFGLVFLIITAAQQKQARKNTGMANVYEFFADCLIIRGVRGGMQTAVFRAEYSKVTKVKEKGCYLVFYYTASASLFPLDKRRLSEEELNTIKKLLHAPLPESAPTITLSSYGDNGQEISVDN